MKFSEMGLSAQMMQALTDMGFETATPIQEQGIPLLLQGEDLIGQAQTGTGKTAAFGIPILEKWLTVVPQNKPPFRPGSATPSALIMAPTRELAVQVAGELYKMGKQTGMHIVPLYGGQNIEKQIREFGRPVDIIVGTPGRILDHIERNTLNLGHVTTLVLDEADRMLDMGFMDDVVNIVRRTPPTRQTMMFSATMPREILNVSYEYMKSPQIIKVSEDKITVDKIKQFYIEVPDPRHRLPLLLGYLNEKKPQLAIIFCRTKMGAEKLGHILRDRDYKSMAMHGDLTQRQRDNAMQAFREGKIHVLVATDLASRGLDVFDVTHVINYDLPEEHTTYVHRIGRTGRMGAEGEAVSLIFPDQMLWVEELVKITGVPLQKIEVVPDGSRGPQSSEGHSPRHYGERREGYGRVREGGRDYDRSNRARGVGGTGHARFGPREGGESRMGGYSRGSGGYGRGREGGAGGYGRRDNGPGYRGGSFGGDSAHSSYSSGASGQTLRLIKERPQKRDDSRKETRHGHTYVGREA